MLMPTMSRPDKVSEIALRLPSIVIYQYDQYMQNVNLSIQLGRLTAKGSLALSAIFHSIVSIFLR